MREILLSAHRRPFDVLRSGPGKFPVELTLALLDLQAAQGGESKVTEFCRELSNNYLEQLRGDDFVGVQKYSRMVIGPEGQIPPVEDVEKNRKTKRTLAGGCRPRQSIKGLVNLCKVDG